LLEEFVKCTLLDPGIIRTSWFGAQ